MRVLERIGQTGIRHSDQLKEEKGGVFDGRIEAAAMNARAATPPPCQMLIQGLQTQGFEGGIRQQARVPRDDRSRGQPNMPMQHFSRRDWIDFEL